MAAGGSGKVGGAVKKPISIKAVPPFFDVWIVRRESKAWRALTRRVFTAGIKPGDMVSVTDAEFESLKADVLRIRVK